MLAFRRRWRALEMHKRWLVDLTEVERAELEGVSVEDSRVVCRIDELVRVPAAVRSLSCEPLIGPLDSRWREYIG